MGSLGVVRPQVVAVPPEKHGTGDRSDGGGGGSWSCEGAGGGEARVGNGRERGQRPGTGKL